MLESDTGIGCVHFATTPPEICDMKPHELESNEQVPINIYGCTIWTGYAQETSVQTYLACLDMYTKKEESRMKDWVSKRISIDSSYLDR